MPGVPCDWLSDTAIVLNSSGTPPAAVTASPTWAASSRCVMLHGIVAVHVDAMPTTGPSSRSGSIPMARKWARAPAREALRGSAARARLRASAVASSSNMARTITPSRWCGTSAAARLESRRMTLPDRPEVRVRITLRWRDMDELLHLNQSVYHELLEEGRMALLEEFLTEDRSFVLARVELDHLREVRRDDGEVEVVVRVTRLGRSSLEVEHDLLRVDGEIAATGRSVLVGWDMRERRKRELTDAERAALGG